MSSRPTRVAIVGSGPAGFYAAGQLLASEADVQVNMFDRLATPWGLVRAGVAPDHPKIKGVVRVYEKTAARPGFRFFGGVEVGRHITHDELLAHHDAVLYATGTAADRMLGIPGEHLPGCHGATAFVAWYNGHPDAADHDFDLSVERAVVVGNGNVALDVARMLVLDHSELTVTDTADHALAALEASAVREVVVLGRRGPAQAAYTNPELLELGELHGADIIVDPAEVELDPASAQLIASGEADVTTRRNVEIVTEYAGRTPHGHPKRMVLRFLASPVEILGTDRVEGVRIVHNELVVQDGAVKAVPTGREEVIEAGLVLRSIGYRGTPIPGVPFDERRSTISNEGGRVTDPQTGAVVPGVYTAGWIKRGPSGVIGTNKKDAQETVDLLLEDLAAGALPTATGGEDALAALLAGRDAEVVDYEGWERINRHETALGEPHGRPRVKLVRTAEQLRVAAEMAETHE